MSSSGSSRSSTLLQPTRQQLDELDALLERMLTLPVNRLDDESDLPVEGAAPPSANSRVARPESANGVGSLDSPLVTPFADSERATPGEPPAPPPRSVVVEQRLQSSEPAPQTTMVQTKTDKVVAPDPRPPWNRQRVRTKAEKGSGTFSAAEKVPDPFSAAERRGGDVAGSRKHKVATSPPHHLTTPLPLWLYPLIWSNRLFDGCAAWFGAAGPLAKAAARPHPARLDRPAPASGSAGSGYPGPDRLDLVKYLGRAAGVSGEWDRKAGENVNLTLVRQGKELTVSGPERPARQRHDGQVVRHLHALRIHHAAIPHQRRIPPEEVIHPALAGPTFFFDVGRFCKPSHICPHPARPTEVVDEWYQGDTDT